MLRKISCAFIGILSCVIAVGCSKSADPYSEAKKLMRNGEYSKAQESYEKAAPDHNADSEFYIDMGHNYIELLNYNAALDSFEHALSIGGEAKRANRGKGIVYYEQGKYKEAKRCFEAAIEEVDIEVGELEEDLVAYKADCEEKLGLYEDAIKSYEALVGLGVKPEKQYMKMGLACLKNNDKKQAGVCFDRILEDKNNDIEIYFSIFEGYRDAGMKDEGNKYLSKALEIEGDSANSHLWRGKIYYLMGTYSAALTELAYPLAENDHEAALYTALCYEEIGEYDKAVDQYYDELDRVYEPVMLNYLALCFVKMGDYNHAWNVVRSAVTDFPDSEYIQNLRWNFIVLYEKTGHFSSALTHLVNYQKDYPDDPLIEEEMEFLMMKQNM